MFLEKGWQICRIFRIRRICTICRVQRQSEFNTSLYFSTWSFMRRTSIIKRLKVNEHKMPSNNQTYRQLVYPGTFTFSTFENRDMVSDVSTMVTDLLPWVERSHLWFSEDVELLFREVRLMKLREERLWCVESWLSLYIVLKTVIEHSPWFHTTLCQSIQNM